MYSRPKDYLYTYKYIFFIQKYNIFMKFGNLYWDMAALLVCFLIDYKLTKRLHEFSNVVSREFVTKPFFNYHALMKNYMRLLKKVLSLLRESFHVMWKGFFSNHGFLSWLTQKTVYVLRKKKWAAPRSSYRNVFQPETARV